VLFNTCNADHAADVWPDDRRLRAVELSTVLVRHVGSHRISVLQVLRTRRHRRHLVEADVVHVASVVAVSAVDSVAHLVPEERATGQI
jgi:hypothetical protein